MSQLLRLDPFRDMLSLRNAMDRLFDDSLTFSRVFDSGAWSLAVDVAEREEDYVLKASIPGMRPDDLDISITDNVLTIKGEMKAEKEVEEAHYHLRERRYGSFTRSVALPTPVNADAVDAAYENGVLTLTVPKAEEVKPRRISVRSPNMIEGQASQA